MFFTLIHELGHMLVGILLGLKPQKLSIMPVGFSVTFATKLNKKGKTNNTTKKLVIAIAGPIINIDVYKRQGPRVIEQTIGEKLPEGFQRAEFLLEHGFIDKIVERKEMKHTLAKLLEMHKK